ncbi:MAG TPA: DUF1572 family protein [Ignavibacteria bacterium]|nr:DUF1572 family protein [Ignavibacteria bacterium]HMR40004.1 DUF1572 family protein [Ignavibacteria bacterium]
MQTFKKLYVDFLIALKKEISLYKHEENIWKLEGDISNTPGNLCLHLCGNLKHFYGAIIGTTGYVRERDLEFSRKNVSRDDLIKEVDETIAMIENVFDGMTPEDVGKIYPISKFGENVTYGFIFSRLISHLSYHIGQINYHRRIID